MLKNTLLHFKTICKHKWLVFIYCCKAGIPLQGFMHDWSKFSPTEFFESVKYYTGTRSPIDKCKEINGYSLAWLHHKGRNPHHYEYWVDYLDNGGMPCIIPIKYLKELCCDWLAAAKVYQGKNFDYAKQLNYVWNKTDSAKMHKACKRYINDVFANLCIGHTLYSSMKVAESNYNEILKEEKEDEKI